MKITNYTTGTLRKEVPDDKPHWAWSLVGMMIALVALSLAGAWIAEQL